jgi:hypothetical protein
MEFNGSKRLKRISWDLMGFNMISWDFMGFDVI